MALLVSDLGTIGPRTIGLSISDFNTMAPVTIALTLGGRRAGGGRRAAGERAAGGGGGGTIAPWPIICAAWTERRLVVKGGAWS